MSDALLSDEELAAIRGAMNTSLPRESSIPDARPMPIAIIAEDQACEAARPDAIRIASRWVQLGKKRVQSAFGIALDLAVAGAELVDGRSLRDELAVSWCCAIDLDEREDGSGLVAVSGPIVETVAAHLFGGPPAEDNADRPPSIAARGVFARCGELLVGALADAWSEEQNAQLVTGREAVHLRRREINEAEVLLAVTANITAPANGRLRLLVRPETLVQPVTALPPPVIPPRAIEQVLGGVPIEVRVELGRASMTMSELAALRPGSIITLDRTLDSLVPIFCGGLVKAHGTIVISKGAMAIEIAVAEDGSQPT